MRRLVSLVLALAVGLALAGTADARRPAGRLAQVLVLEHGHVHVKRERFLGPPGPAASAAARPSTSATASPARPTAAAASKAKKPPPKGRAARVALDGLLAQGAIDQPTRDARQAQLRAALRAYKSLAGTRRLELGAVIDNVDQIAASGQLTPPRLNPVFATLAANATWWQDGTIPAKGARVSVDGSPVIWQYYPGQGIELQQLANFGKANALWAAKKAGALRQLLDQLLPLAVDRGGWPGFEYYFQFGGGKPPWVSSIAQGTAVQALARAGQLLGDPNLTSFGEQALGAFEQPPPAGVREDSPTGPFYLIYSFAPDELVINAHLQALVGLYDFAQITGDPRALGLFQQGDAEAQAVLPSYDTGAWSMYDTAHESDLSYHDLVTGFLKNLCARTATRIYCDTATRFRQYRSTPPVTAPVTKAIRAGKPAKLAFTVDKIARVGIAVSDENGATVYATSAIVGHGQRFYNWSKPAAPGLYTFRVTATDLAGNRGEPADGQLRILPKRQR